MKKTSLSILFLFLSFFSFTTTHAQSIPTIPANGFNCSKTQMMVSCKGVFPGVPGVFQASGAHQVNIQYETPNNPGHRYSFDSSNGCMMRVDFDVRGNSQLVSVWDKNGNNKDFVMPSQQAQAQKFCLGK